MWYYCVARWGTDTDSAKLSHTNVLSEASPTASQGIRAYTLSRLNCTQKKKKKKKKNPVLASFPAGTTYCMYIHRACRGNVFGDTLFLARLSQSRGKKRARR